MSLPDGWTPYVSSRRRWLWLCQQRATREESDGVAATYLAVRLETYGTPLPNDLPARSRLLAAGVLALEEVRGAGVTELLSYGLTLSQAHALINRIETDTELDVPEIFQAGPNLGQEYETDSVTLLASTAITAGAAGSSYELGDKGTLRLTLDVTAIAASGQLRVQVETRVSSSDTWRPIGAFSPATAVTAQYREFPGCNRYVRIYYGLTGASATFSVSGNAV